jgi:hypothetical protein
MSQCGHEQKRNLRHVVMSTCLHVSSSTR